MNLYREISIDELDKIREEFMERYFGGWHKATCEFHQSLVEGRKGVAKKILDLECNGFNMMREFKEIDRIYRAINLIDNGQKVYTDL
ncbi:hypothetical protein BigBertha_189 [Bacillus phage BigBertha]|uniref:Uncharacterized protein n=1 Tax=Bacillus phage BigBertha TaxID=1406781 RepID=U5PVR9_9CAUD|nr:hypothetical protein BigBertha_189 [Bacillus phage BigBertha]AGY46697.1 hypothetical protein BigBertha_189 [Bacillus phage BigBertha]